MKIHLEIDCTPEEARAFLGMPEVKGMQDRMMAEIEARMSEAIKTTDPKTLLDQWLPLGLRGIEQWQGFWTQMLAGAAGIANNKPGADKTPGDSGGRG
ncbi:MAG: DUF6489 family protein [Geminicoccaceae bacterium]